MLFSAEFFENMLLNAVVIVIKAAALICDNLKETTKTAVI